MARRRMLEKYELNAIGECDDPALREKLEGWAMRKKEPLNPYELKKLKDRIERHKQGKR